MELEDRLNAAITNLTQQLPGIANDADKLGKFSKLFTNNMEKAAHIVSDNKFRNIYRDQEQNLKGVVEALKKQYKFAKDISREYRENKKDLKKGNDELKSAKSYAEKLRNQTQQRTVLEEKILNNLDQMIEKKTIEAKLQEETNKMMYESMPRYMQLLGKFGPAIEGIGKGLANTGKLFKAIGNFVGNIIQKGFEIISELIGTILKNLFEVEKLTGNTAADMGLTTEQTRLMSKATADAASEALLLGSNLEDVLRIQTSFAELIGKNVLLTKQQLLNVVAIGKGTAIGADGAAEMMSSYDLLGKSVENFYDFISLSSKSLQVSGLNSQKVFKIFSDLLPKAILWGGTLKDGSNTLFNMSKLAAKFRFELDGIFDLAENVFNPEGAIELAAQLKVLGGGFGSLADPFRLMYQGQNDVESLTKDIISATAASARWNATTGEFQIQPKQLGIIREVASATGISAENLAKMAIENAKMVKKYNELDKSGVSFNKDMKEYISTIMEFDKTGKAFVNIKDGINVISVGVDKLSQSNISQIEAQMKSTQSLENSARLRMNLMEKLQSIGADFFMRISSSLNQLLKGDRLTALIDKITQSANYLIQNLGTYLDNLLSPDSKLMTGITKFFDLAQNVADKLINAFNEDGLKGIGKELVSILGKVILPLAGDILASVWKEVKPLIIKTIVGAGVGLALGAALALIPGIGPALAAGAMPALAGIGAAIGAGSGINTMMHDGRIGDPRSALVQTGSGAVNVQKFAKGDALYAINEKSLGGSTGSVIHNNFNMPPIITVKIEGGQTHMIGKDEIIRIIAANYQDVANKSSKIAATETNTSQQGKRNPKMPVTPLV